MDGDISIVAKMGFQVLDSLEKKKAILPFSD